MSAETVQKIHFPVGTKVSVSDNKNSFKGTVAATDEHHITVQGEHHRTNILKASIYCGHSTIKKIGLLEYASTS